MSSDTNTLSPILYRIPVCTALESSYQVFSHLSSEEQGLLFSWLYQKSPHSRRSYQRIWTEFLRYFLKPMMSFKEIEISHLVVFLKSKEHLKPSSQNLVRNTLSSFLSFLTKTGYLEKNPALTLDSIAVPNRVGSKILSLDQIMRMHECEKSLRNKIIIKFLYFSGIRVNELCQLKMKDLRVKSESHLLIQVLGKGGKVRAVLVPIYLYYEILEYKQSLRGDNSLEDPVFLSTRSGSSVLSPSQVFRIVQQAAKKAKVYPVPSPHWFRHTSATHAIENGAPIHVVQNTLGHKNITTTGKYLEANPRDSNSRWLKWETTF